MKHTSIHPHINPVAASAVSTFEADGPPKPKKKFSFSIRTIYALVASGHQFADDPRLEVIDHFVKALRKHRKGAVREFIVDALHKAIVSKAEQAKHKDSDDTFQMS